LLTAQELAEALKVTVNTIWTYTRQGKIPVVEQGNKHSDMKKTLFCQIWLWRTCLSEKVILYISGPNSLDFLVATDISSSH